MPHILRFPLAALILAASVACGDDESTPKLAKFEDCDELNTWIKESATMQVNYVAPPGLGSGTVRSLEGDVATTQYAGPVAIADESAGGGSFSVTNVQEDGVDEADFIKNDGDHFFVVDRSGLAVYDVWPAEELHAVSRVDIEGLPTSLFFDAVNTAVVFSSIQGADPSPASGDTSMTLDRTSWNPMTKVTVLDVADRAAPEVVREIYFQGALRASRRIGDKVHIVATRWMNSYLYEGDGGSSRNRHDLRVRIDGADAEDWMPTLQDNVRSGETWNSTTTTATACSDVYRPNVRTALQFVTVMTVDLADPAAPIDSVGVMTRADTVYSSTENLYLALTEHSSGPFRSRDQSIDTRVHKFTLDGGPVYTASGRVPGSMLNQFSLSEHEGDLRVATTDWNADTISSGVYVLGQDGTVLAPVGQVDGIAPGESIFAVRFAGDKGYVVTFERIDPLFTLDLSDRLAPRVVGELEVTGFSNYLHPLGDGAEHLLAVGEEIAENGWEWLGMQVSLFDVSTFDAPTMTDRVVLEADGNSEAQYDHHAFTYFADLSTLALPFSGWDWDAERSTGSLELFAVDTVDGLERIGSIDHDEVVRQAPEDAAWCAQVRRSVFVEDYVFAISDVGIQVVMHETPDVTVATALYEDGGCRGWGGEDGIVVGR